MAKCTSNSYFLSWLLHTTEKSVVPVYIITNYTETQFSERNLVIKNSEKIALQ